MSVIHIERDRNGTIATIKIRRPSNFHAHFRRGALMRAITLDIVRHLRYALAMPNNGPITSISAAGSYYIEIRNIIEAANITTFKGLLMTLYHASDVTPDVIEKIAHSSIVRAIKNYPAHPGATTGSGQGVALEDAPETLRAMEVNGVPLLGHFEDVYDKDGRELPHKEREAHCVENRLWRLRDKYPNLRICCEHASTEAMVRFVKADESGRTVMTVTPQHLNFTFPDLSLLSYWHDLKCMPIVKDEPDQHCRHQLRDFRRCTRHSRRRYGGASFPHQAG